MDDGPIAGGQSERTSAHLSNAIDNRYMEIEKIHGVEGAHLTPGHSADLLESEREAARRAGLADVEMVPRSPLSSFDTGPALHLLRQWSPIRSSIWDRFSMMRTVDYRWSGMVMETADGLTFIGRNSMDAENVSIATGDSDSGMGSVHGTIAGMHLMT